jgi:hypothetical protein
MKSLHTYSKSVNALFAQAAPGFVDQSAAIVDDARWSLGGGAGAMVERTERS